jgi:hypothetical protein
MSSRFFENAAGDRERRKPSFTLATSDFGFRCRFVRAR